MKIAQVLWRLALLLLAMGLGALCLGAFAGLNSAAPTSWRTLSAFEGLLATESGLSAVGNFARALAEAALCALAVYGTALPAPARSASARRSG